MDRNVYQTLEYDKILRQLADLAVSAQAREALLALEPMQDLGLIAQHSAEIAQAREILEKGGTPPLAQMEGMEAILALLPLGGLLGPDQLSYVATFLSTCRRMRVYLQKAAPWAPTVAAYGMSLDPLPEVQEEIDRCIRAGAVDLRATPRLRDLSRHLEMGQARIRQKLESLLRAHPEWFMESYVTERGGRFALPVKRQYRKNIEGSVVDTSQSGGTVFVEPASVARMLDELHLVQIEMQNEIQAVLYTLTGLVAEGVQALKIDCEGMLTLDVLFAKAMLSLRMDARPAPVTDEGEIVIVQGRHPLLRRESAVPLDFAIGGQVQAIVITGPNTGGKTVALKTVGLLNLMAQSGLHVPAAEGTRFTRLKQVLADIGDGQSIEQNLSTFSSHMTNMIGILRQAGPGSLVLVDELGSGTDPAEGMGLAVALLEALKAKGCLLVGTTHYPEVKHFAQHTPGFLNARMAFDRATLQPLFRLDIGLAGESCALQIAQRLGLPQALVERAHEMAYGDKPKAWSAAPTTPDSAPRQPTGRPRPPSRIAPHRPRTPPRRCRTSSCPRPDQPRRTRPKWPRPRPRPGAANRCARISRSATGSPCWTWDATAWSWSRSTARARWRCW